MHKHTRLWACPSMLRLGDPLRDCPGDVHFILKQGLSVVWRLLPRLTGQVAQRSSCLHLPGAGITSVQKHGIWGLNSGLWACPTKYLFGILFLEYNTTQVGDKIGRISVLWGFSCRLRALGDHGDRGWVSQHICGLGTLLPGAYESLWSWGLTLGKKYGSKPKKLLPRTQLNSLSPLCTREDETHLILYW